MVMEGQGWRESGNGFGEHLANRGVKTASSEPQDRQATSTAPVSGLCSDAARKGRHSRSTPLREEGRIRVRTEWNGNGAGARAPYRQ